jgi:hypothetical protein
MDELTKSARDAHALLLTVPPATTKQLKYRNHGALTVPEWLWTLKTVSENRFCPLGF